MMSREAWMIRALSLARTQRRIAPPNPWVGCVIVDDNNEEVASGATGAPGESHAEIVALRSAGAAARGATMYVTLEPCSHVGRTGPCTEAIVDAGISRVEVATEDPDARVAGAGVRALRDAGLVVRVGMLESAVREELASYLWHRTTGRPYVVLKVAATLDGRVATADGTSQWITGAAARADGHDLRANSQAVLVGAGTVRTDNPSLTARLDGVTVEPLRVVLGTAAPDAKVHPCWERSGDLGVVLDELGASGVLQLLVEGGPRTASEFVERGLVNRVVWYVAPAIAGAEGGLGALAELATSTMAALRRGRFLHVRQIGEDIRIEMEI
jgi:diaminohydroxyphosphoribosylaminopyrimidine deaminase/5-amino-6-(5-phosphoribosylamino)uracil reductase